MRGQGTRVGHPENCVRVRHSLLKVPGQLEGGESSKVVIKSWVWTVFSKKPEYSADLS